MNAKITLTLPDTSLTPDQLDRVRDILVCALTEWHTSPLVDLTNSDDCADIVIAEELASNIEYYCHVEIS